MPLIRRKFYPPKKEVVRDYRTLNRDRKIWESGFKDVIEEEDEDKTVQE